MADVSVPVVDLRDYFDENKREHFIQTLGDAIQNLGFVRVKGHNVKPQVTQPAYNVAQEFFALPEEIKRQYVVQGGAGQRGYTPYLAESAKNSSLPDLKEFCMSGESFHLLTRCTASINPIFGLRKYQILGIQCLISMMSSKSARTYYSKQLHCIWSNQKIASQN